MARFSAAITNPTDFYPVLNESYAIQIGRSWNTQDAASGYAGFVTRFKVEDAFISRYEVVVAVGTSEHRELWIPAEEISMHLIKRFAGRSK